MSFYGSETSEISVDGSINGAVAAFDVIQEWRTDDPDLSLETVDDATMQRVSMRFIGWPHHSDYAPLLAEKIAAFEPQVIIEESSAYTRNSRNTAEALENLRIRNIAAWALNPDTNEYEEVPEDSMYTPWTSAYELLAAKSISPIVRKMDVTHEDVSESLRPLLTPKLLQMWHELDGYIGLFYSHHSFDTLRDHTGHLLEKEYYLERIRSATMIADISRIAANALTKTDEEVKIAVTAGANHTELYRHFRRLGLAVDREFIHQEGTETDHVYDFGSMALVRRSLFESGSFTPEKTEKYMLTRLFEHRLFPETGALSNAEFDIISCRGMKLLGDQEIAEQLLAAWKNIKGGRTAFSRRKALKRFDQGMTGIIEQALET